MTPTLDLIRGQTFHGRSGDTENAFRYSVDYLLLDPDATGPLPWLMSRNRANVMALMDRDNGGPRGQGRSTAWVRHVLAERGLDHVDGQILLLSQPRMLGHVFNPVSFWLVYDMDGGLRIAIAEVNNTFGHRHNYLIHHDDLRPITPSDVLTARKAFHVSPFLPVEGEYKFRFDMRPDRIGVWIDYHAGDKRLFTNLIGPRRRLTSWEILRSALRRPAASWRVLGLIHMQALVVWLKGAKYTDSPAPPRQDMSS